jgi:chromosome segregation ATPase
VWPVPSQAAEKPAILQEKVLLLANGGNMATDAERVAALEKDAATMKRDIIYKLDDTNSAITILKGVLGNQGQDVKETKGRIRVIEAQLSEVTTRLEGIKEEVREVKERIGTLETKLVIIARRMDEQFASSDARLASLEGKLDQALQLLTTLTHKAE